MSIHSQGVVETVSKHIFESFLKDMPSGRKIRIESVDQSFAIEIAKVLRLIVERNVDVETTDPVLIAVIDEKNPDGDLTISVPRAIELRNRRSRILYLDPESVGATNGNLGANAFDTRSLLEVYSGVITSLSGDVKNLEDGEIALKAISRNIPANTSVLSYAELLLALLNSERTLRSLGENLWRIGLIPDRSENVIEKLADNSRVADILSGRTRPLSSGSDRLEAAGVTPGAFRDAVQRLLEPFPKDFNNWLRSLSEEQSFHLWPISSRRFTTLRN